MSRSTVTERKQQTNSVREHTFGKVVSARPWSREDAPFWSRSQCLDDELTESVVLSLFTLQIFLWEQNLEQFHMDLFRFRCYLASLQGGELPNPKRLLAVASRPTKLAMGRLGIFSVSSFHALVTSSL